MDAVAINQFFSSKSQRQKIARTIALTVGWICMGLYLNITGPTLIDLKLRIGVNYDQISDALAGQDIGYFVGTAITGVCVARFVARCDLMIGVGLTLAALATACIPFTMSLRLLWFFCLLNGTTVGVLDVAGQKLILMIWQEKSPAPMYIAHGGYGIGGFIVPLIANPFLAVLRSRPTSNNSSVNSTLEYMSMEYTQDSITNTTSEYENKLDNRYETNTRRSRETETVNESQIEIAYLIVASFVMAISIVFYIYKVSDVKQMKHFKTKNKQIAMQTTKKSTHTNIKEVFNPATCADGHALYGAAIFAVLFLFYFNLVGIERVVGMYIRAFSIEQLGFSVDSGSYLNTSYLVSYAVGRLAGFLVARWIPIRIIMLADSVGIFIWSVLMNIFASNNSLAFWILVQPLGLFIGPGFPTGMGWADYHVDLAGMAICLLVLGGSLGGWVHVRLAGYLFETFGPRVFLYHALGLAVALFVLAIMLHLIGARRGNRYKRSTDGKEDIVLEALDEINADPKHKTQRSLI